MTVVYFQNDYKFSCFDKTCSELALEEYKRSHDERFQYQSDIIHERTRVEKLKEYEYQMKPLVVSNVSKKFGKKFAVSRVTLAMERGECFGLLGANDSGKTTLIRLLVGELNITSGRAYVHGVSVLDDILRVYELIGYCPNCHSFPSHMTCHQILHFFCQLRGIPPNLNEEICLSFAKLFGIMKNFDKQFSYTSPGVRRRLGTAISFIGNPHIIFLDSLTVGIDPAEHDPVISERYCTRVGIISNGNLLCVDYVGQLQTRYAKAYCLHLKVKSSLRSEENTSKLTISHHRLSLSHNILKIISYIDDAFPDATLIYHHGTSLCFIIPSKNTSLSQIFKKIKRKTVTFYVETFSVHWETLPLLMDDLVKREDIHNDK